MTYQLLLGKVTKYKHKSVEATKALWVYGFAYYFSLTIKLGCIRESIYTCMQQIESLRHAFVAS